MECRRGLAMRILSVRLSVRPSVTRVNCDKTVTDLDMELTSGASVYRRLVYIYNEQSSTSDQE